MGASVTETIDHWRQEPAAVVWLTAGSLGIQPSGLLAGYGSTT